MAPGPGVMLRTSNCCTAASLLPCARLAGENRDGRGRAMLPRCALPVAPTQPCSARAPPLPSSQFLKDPKQYASLDAKPPKGILLEVGGSCGGGSCGSSRRSTAAAHARRLALYDRAAPSGVVSLPHMLVPFPAFRATPVLARRSLPRPLPARQRCRSTRWLAGARGMARHARNLPHGAPQHALGSAAAPNRCPCIHLPFAAPRNNCASYSLTCLCTILIIIVTDLQRVR